MTPERIAVEVSVAVAAVKRRMATEHRVFPVPLASTKCRWCGKAIHAGMFCGRGCAHEFYGTTEADRDE